MVAFNEDLNLDLTINVTRRGQLCDKHALLWTSETRVGCGLIQTWERNEPSSTSRIVHNKAGTYGCRTYEFLFKRNSTCGQRRPNRRVGVKSTNVQKAVEGQFWEGW